MFTDKRDTDILPTGDYECAKFSLKPFLHCLNSFSQSLHTQEKLSGQISSQFTILDLALHRTATKSVSISVT